jgi:hypothetical protein
MPNRRLNPSELASLNALLDEVRKQIDGLSQGDPELRFALNRRMFNRLMHDERGTPADRTKLKAEKWKAQEGRCAICNRLMEQKGSELDRTEASNGYTAANTRLVHHDCHVNDQSEKGFTDRDRLKISN